MDFSKKDTQKKLQDIDQRKVAIGLSDIFISQFKDEVVKKKLEDIRDIVWARPDTDNARPNDYDRDTRRRNQDMQRIQEVLAEVTDASQKTAIAEAYVRLGHLYEIAGHAARENFFQAREQELAKKLAKFQLENPKKPPPKAWITPGGVHELLFHNDNFKSKSVSQVVQELSQPISEYVFTQHPTNTNTPASMQLQREIADALDKVTDKQTMADKDVYWQKLETNIAQFAKDPIVQNKNFTAYDETRIVINFLTNVYHDIDRLYEVTERGLSRKFGEAYNNSERWNLDLKQRFSSWGSAGDKDGNNNIKSENTLEAIILHKKKAAELLLESIDGIEALASWKDKFQTAVRGYGEIEEKIAAVRNGGNDIPLISQQFKDMSQAVKKISNGLGKSEDFLGDVKKVAVNATGEQKNKLLTIHRKARIFGFSLGKIEYRETADMYESVLNFLMKTDKAKEVFGDSVKGFSGKGRKERTEWLTEILRDPQSAKQLAEVASAFMQNVEARNLRDYKDKAKGDETITYHTLRRMQLAHDFNDMITHNVLAECKGTHNLLDALAVQTAVRDASNKRAKMHIVPLFEEAETMEKIPNILKEALNNDVYTAHLKELKINDDTPNIVQQIQIAHSDNARRAGAIASRGIIHRGHHAAREAIENYNKEHSNAKVDLQFFEGGSQSDSYRNGVRAVTAVIKDFGLSNFSKMTFQGGDLLNYFNQPTSCERLMLRSIVEQAKLLNSEKPFNGNHGKLEEEIVATIENLQHQYDVAYYGKPSNPIGKILHALGYRKQAAAGSAGTRGNRNIVDYSNERITGVNPKDVRTIGFSEGFQHGGLHPACLGTKSLENDLGARIFANEEAKSEIPADIPAFDANGKLTASGLKYLYKNSPTFKDALDKMGYSLINTRVYPFTNKLESYQQTLGGPRDKTLDDAYNDVIQEYKEVGDLVYKAFTEQEISHDQHRLISRDNSMKALDRTITLLKTIPELEHYESLNYKHRFVDGLDIIEKWANLQDSRLMHNARDTLYHGRTFVADDPNYGRTLTEAKRAQQNDKIV